MPTGTDAILSGKPLNASGSISKFDRDVDLPEDATTPLPADGDNLGYVDEDGVTRTVDASDDKIKAWGGDTVKVIRSDYSVTYTMKFMESANGTLLKAVHGDANVKITAPVTTGANRHNGKVAIIHNSRMVPRAAYVIEMLDENTFIREVIPNGQLTTSDDVQFVHSAVITYSVTIEAMADKRGNNSYEYQDTMPEDLVEEIKALLTGVESDLEPEPAP